MTLQYHSLTYPLTGTLIGRHTGNLLQMKWLYASPLNSTGNDPPVCIRLDELVVKLTNPEIRLVIPHGYKNLL